MAKEKTVPVQIDGTLKKANTALFRCCENKSFCIQPPHSGITQQGSSEFETLKTLKGRNPYAELMKRAEKLAEYFGKPDLSVDYHGINYSVSVDFKYYFDSIDAHIKDFTAEREKLSAEKKRLEAELALVGHFAGMHCDFERLYSCEYINVRFGCMPVDNYPKLAYYKHENFFFYPYHNDGINIWGMYIVMRRESVELDRIFDLLCFRRIRLPDDLTGDADNACSKIHGRIMELNKSIALMNSQIEVICSKERAEYDKVCAKLAALDSSFRLRTNVLVFNNKFRIMGMVGKHDSKRFISAVEADGVAVKIRRELSKKGR